MQNAKKVRVGRATSRSDGRAELSFPRELDQVPPAHGKVRQTGEHTKKAWWARQTPRRRRQSCQEWQDRPRMEVGGLSAELYLCYCSQYSRLGAVVAPQVTNVCSKTC